MLRKAYAGAGRLAHKTLTPFLKMYVTERHVRVRTLIVNDDKEVLLVRSWLGHQRWTLPGGGIRRSETPAEAAAREVHEETGLRLAADQLKELGSFSNTDSSAGFTVLCYAIEVAKREPRIARHRRLEMLDIAWFPLDSLPAEHSHTVSSALELWRTTRK